MKKTEVTKISVDTFTLEVENILEEYLLMKTLDDVKYFIDTRCADAITKNRFCEVLFNLHFTKDYEVMELLKNLINLMITKLNLNQNILTNTVIILTN
jgi:hypothetical protein